jgi:hypothetical protein
MDRVRSRNNERPEPPTLDEILAPVRKEFVESGMTEEELEVLIDEAREEVWQEEHTQEASS